MPAELFSSRMTVHRGVSDEIGPPLFPDKFPSQKTVKHHLTSPIPCSKTPHFLVLGPSMVRSFGQLRHVFPALPRPGLAPRCGALHSRLVPGEALPGCGDAGAGCGRQPEVSHFRWILPVSSNMAWKSLGHDLLLLGHIVGKDGKLWENNAINGGCNGNIIEVL